MPQKVKVAQVIDLGRLDIVEKDIPPLKPSDLLVKVDMVGVCGTDTHLVYSRKPYSDKSEVSYPFDLGHEPVGTIVEMGKESLGTDYDGNTLHIGDRITWVEYLIRGRGIGGAFAEYAYIPGDVPVFKIPETLSTEIAVLAEPMACAVRILERAFQPGTPDHYPREGLGFGTNVVIQGSGTIGALITGLAEFRGVYQTFVIGAPDSRLQICQAFGADWILNFQKTSSEERLKQVQEKTPQHRGADVVIQGAGSPQAFEEALDLVRQGGTVVEFGHGTDHGTAKINPEKIVNKGITIFGSLGYQVTDMGLAVRLLDKYQERLPFEQLITHRFRLDQIQEAIDCSREAQCMKAVILP